MHVHAEMIQFNYKTHANDLSLFSFFFVGGDVDLNFISWAVIKGEPARIISTGMMGGKTQNKG